MIIPNIWENKKCSKPPTRYVSHYLRESNVVLATLSPFSSIRFSEHIYNKWAPRTKIATLLYNSNKYGEG